jgi:hypothetical protein
MDGAAAPQYWPFIIGFAIVATYPIVVMLYLLTQKNKHSQERQRTDQPGT